MPRVKTHRKQTLMIMHSKNEGHTCGIDWKIDNVFNYPYKIFTFKANLGRGCKTHLNVQVIIKETYYGSDFYLGYKRTDEQKNSIRVIFNLELLNAKGDVYMATKAKFTSKTAQKYDRVLKIKFADAEYFISATKLTEDQLRESDDDVLKKVVASGLVVMDEESLHKFYSLPEDSITVKGFIKVFACCVPSNTKPINKNSSEDISIEIKKSELIQHLQSAFISGIENSMFTDITFKIQDESVQAHKFILSARSPKFKRLFEPDSEGNSISEILVQSMEKKVLMHFLQYLYTGLVGLVKWKVIEKLYEAAIEYEVHSLKELCRKKFILSLNDRRAVRALLFAYKHKDEDLKEATINFIKNIYFRFKNTDCWKSFRDDNPGLATEVISCVIDSI